MASHLKSLAVVLALSCGGVALADEPAKPAPAPAPAATPPAPVTAPSPEAVKAAWDYYYRGQGQGPLLVDLKLCTELVKDGPLKYECAKEVAAGTPVKQNTTLLVWQAYLVPQGDVVEDIMVQVKQGELIRETKDVKVKGDIWRTRTQTAVRIGKPGTWTITVLRGDKVLRTVTVTAVK